MISGFLFDSGSAIPMLLRVPKKDQMNPASHSSKNPSCSLGCTNTRQCLLICLDDSNPFSERRNIFFGGGLSFTWQSAQVFDLMGKWWWKLLGLSKDASFPVWHFKLALREASRRRWLSGGKRHRFFPEMNLQAVRRYLKSVTSHTWLRWVTVQQPWAGERRNRSHRAVWTGRKLTFQGTETPAGVSELFSWHCPALECNLVQHFHSIQEFKKAHLENLGFGKPERVPL